MPDVACHLNAIPTLCGRKIRQEGELLRRLITLLQQQSGNIYRSYVDPGGSSGLHSGGGYAAFCKLGSKSERSGLRNAASYRRAVAHEYPAVQESPGCEHITRRTEHSPK